MGDFAGDLYGPAKQNVLSQAMLYETFILSNMFRNLPLDPACKHQQESTLEAL